MAENRNCAYLMGKTKKESEINFVDVSKVWEAFGYQVSYMCSEKFSDL